METGLVAASKSGCGNDTEMSDVEKKISAMFFFANLGREAFRAPEHLVDFHLFRL